MNTSDNENSANKPGAGDSKASGRSDIPFRDNSLDSRDLFADNREVTIIHGGETYRLRLTAQNKLILTK